MRIPYIAYYIIPVDILHTFSVLVILKKHGLMGIEIIIIVHRCHVTKTSHLHSQVVPTGKGNVIGNKGATAISFQFQETSFVFINAHLAARAEK